MIRRWVCGALIAGLHLTGCGTSSTVSDAGGRADASTETRDAGAPDSGTGMMDAGIASVDAGTLPVDAGTPPVDAVVLTPDAGPPDAGMLCPTLRMFGPTPYLSRADSPFIALAPSMLVVDDFEDRMVEHTGVQACGDVTTGTACAIDVTSPALIGTGGSSEGLVDSVDGDDGMTDGICTRVGETCHSVFAGSLLRFEFSPAALGGALPNAVGLVYTDAGGGTITFRAFDASGALIGTVGPSSEAGVFPDGSITGTVAEDRFFGICAPIGIAAIEMQGTGSGLEADHLQYAR